MTPDKPDPRRRAQRARSIAIGLLLGFLVILFFVMTLVRLGGHALDG